MIEILTDAAELTDDLLKAALYANIRKLRFLLYTNSMPDNVVALIRQDPEGIVFLNDDPAELLAAEAEAMKIVETEPVTPWKQQTPRNEVLRLRDITAEFELQCRKEPDEDRVREYASDMERGVQFPPLIVFFDGTHHWLADGFHRYWAAQLTGRREFEATVYEGGKAQVVAYAAGANNQHGLRRTNADKQRAVRKLFVDLGLGNRSDHVVADLAGVDHKTVGKIRRELTEFGEIPHYEERIGSDGRKILGTLPCAAQVPQEQVGPSKEKKVSKPKVAKQVEVSGLVPAYPEGFSDGLEDTQKLLALVAAFKPDHQGMLAVGFSRAQVGELIEKLREMADRFEAAAALRPAQVPTDEKKLVMCRSFETFILGRGDCKSLEFIELPSIGEDGKWYAEVVYNGRPRRYWFHDKFEQWHC